MATDSKLEFWKGDTGITTVSFSDEDSNILSKYVTNLDSNVFAWKLNADFTPEQAGALLSRYSRTSFTGRELFVKEFYPNKDRGKEFFESWLVDYGDDSIQEMAGGLPTSCEYISCVAAKHIEDVRFGSFIEKSTRYVAFDKKLSNGQYMYYKDKAIMESSFGDEYVELMQGLFDSYVKNTEPMMKYLQEKNPFNEQTFRIVDVAVKPTEFTSEIEEKYNITVSDLETAYQRATKANALDFMRDFLPMSTLTHVGISANARVYDGMLNKLAASNLEECRWIAKRLHGELSKLVPSLLRRTYEKHGLEHQDYLSSSRENVAAALQTAGVTAPNELVKSTGGGVRLEHFTGEGTENPDKIAKSTVVADLIFTRGLAENREEAFQKAFALDDAKLDSILNAYVGSRQNRRHRPGRAFESVDYKFGFKGRIGIYRDIQRHRVGTQERTDFGVALGYNTRKEYVDIGIEKEYDEKMHEVIDLHNRVRSKLGAPAQYIVTFGFDINWMYNTNARQLFHMFELRSSPGGHPDYRKLVQDAYRKVEAVHPSITKQMNFMNMSESQLGRLNSEIRIAQKKNLLKK